MIGTICKYLGGYVLAGTAGGMTGCAVRRVMDGTPQDPLGDFMTGYNLTVLAPYIVPIWVRTGTIDVNLQIGSVKKAPTTEVVTPSDAVSALPAPIKAD
jgi:hypothetical protein